MKQYLEYSVSLLASLAPVRLGLAVLDLLYQHVEGRSRVGRGGGVACTAPGRIESHVSPQGASWPDNDS